MAICIDFASELDVMSNAMLTRVRSAKSLEEIAQFAESVTIAIPEDQDTTSQNAEESSPGSSERIPKSFGSSSDSGIEAYAKPPSRKISPEEQANKDAAQKICKAFWNDRCKRIEIYEGYPYRLKIAVASATAAIVVATYVAIYLIMNFYWVGIGIFTKVMISLAAFLLVFPIIFIYWISSDRLIYEYSRYIKRTEFSDITSYKIYLEVFIADPTRARAYNWILEHLANYECEIATRKYGEFTNEYLDKETEIRRRYRLTFPPAIKQFDYEYGRYLRKNEMTPGDLSDIIIGLLPKDGFVYWAENTASTLSLQSADPVDNALVLNEVKVSSD